MNRKTIELRKEANAVLNSVVDVMIQDCTDLRYIQILWNIGIVDSKDRFYEEPIDTLKRCYDKIIAILHKTGNFHLEEEINKLIRINEYK